MPHPRREDEPQTLRELWRSMMEEFGDTQDTLENVLKEQIKTNGRITRIEQWRQDQDVLDSFAAGRRSGFRTSFAVLMAGVGIVSSVATALIPKLVKLLLV